MKAFFYLMVHSIEEPIKSLRHECSSHNVELTVCVRLWQDSVLCFHSCLGHKVLLDHMNTINTMCSRDN